MTHPDYTTLIVALGAVSLLAVVLGALLARRLRDIRQVQEVGERLAAVASSGA